MKQTKKTQTNKHLFLSNILKYSIGGSLGSKLNRRQLASYPRSFISLQRIRLMLCKLMKPWGTTGMKNGQKV